MRPSHAHPRDISYQGYEAHIDSKTGLQYLVKRDFQAIYQHCTQCGHPQGTQYCDFVVGGEKWTCDRPLCKACAVHVPSLPDTDYCLQHARELGIHLILHQEEFENLRNLRVPPPKRPIGYHVQIPT